MIKKSKRRKKIMFSDNKEQIAICLNCSKEDCKGDCKFIKRVKKQ